MKTFEEYKREKEEKQQLSEATVEKKDDDSFPSLSVDEMAAVDASPVKEGSYLSFSDWKNGKDKPVQEFKEYKDEPLDLEEMTEAIDESLLDEGILHAVGGVARKTTSAVKSGVKGAFFAADSVRQSSAAKAAGVAVAGGAGYQAFKSGAGIANSVNAGLATGLTVATAVGLVTYFIRNRNKYELQFRDKIGQTTRSMVQKLYYQAFASMISKRDLHMDIKQSGNSIIITSRYVLPGKKPARIILDVGFRQVSIFPENTGGSTSLDRFSFDGSTIKSVTGKAIGKGQGGRYIGNEKIPNRALNYREDIAKIFLITCDLITEIYADYADYFESVAKRINASRSADVNVFLALESRYDLNSAYIKEKSPEERER